MEPVSNTQTELIGYLSVLSVPTVPTEIYDRNNRRASIIGLVLAAIIYFITK